MYAQGMKKKKPSTDVNVTAFQILRAVTAQPSTDSPKKNPAAVALGRMGGKVGGKARAESLSEDRRKEIALKAARARWDKKS